jgi:hypothetical protein
MMRETETCGKKEASLPGLTRQSIVLTKKMDARVKPGHDDAAIGAH